jgi:hypothetical protein
MLPSPLLKYFSLVSHNISIFLIYSEKSIEREERRRAKKKKENKHKEHPTLLPISGFSSVIQLLLGYVFNREPFSTQRTPLGNNRSISLFFFIYL